MYGFDRYGSWKKAVLSRSRASSNWEALMTGSSCAGGGEVRRKETRAVGGSCPCLAGGAWRQGACSASINRRARFTPRSPALSAALPCQPRCTRLGGCRSAPAAGEADQCAPRPGRGCCAARSRAWPGPLAARRQPAQLGPAAPAAARPAPAPVPCPCRHLHGVTGVVQSTLAAGHGRGLLPCACGSCGTLGMILPVAPTGLTGSRTGGGGIVPGGCDARLPPAI